MGSKKKRLATIGAFRQIKDDEIELIRQWRNAPSVRNNMYYRHEISEAEHNAWWEKVRHDVSKYYFFYVEKNQPLGVVSFSDIDLANKNCSWAFYTCPDAPKGVGTKMEFSALDYAFLELKLYKLYCEVLSSNLVVVKMHQKFGFHIEGIFREHHAFEGKFIDIYRLGILKTEWDVQREVMAAKIESYVSSPDLQEGTLDAYAAEASISADKV